MLNELSGKVVDPFPVNVPLDHAQSVASARHVANAHTVAYPTLQRVAGQVARLEGFPLSPPPLSSFPSVSYTHTHARVANRFTEETPLAARWIESPIRQKNAPFLHLALLFWAQNRAPR